MRLTANGEWLSQRPHHALVRYGPSRGREFVAGRGRVCKQVATRLPGLAAPVQSALAGEPGSVYEGFESTIRGGGHETCYRAVALIIAAAMSVASAQGVTADGGSSVAGYIPGGTANVVRPVAVVEREEIELSGMKNVRDLVLRRLESNHENGFPARAGIDLQKRAALRQRHQFLTQCRRGRPPPSETAPPHIRCRAESGYPAAIHPALQLNAELVDTPSRCLDIASSGVDHIRRGS